ncbi:MAG TPA: hypothetical protein VN622_09055 [Clostridia bacterium]|nr:hypothetical protein [Clostridia bacterium]
MRDIKKINAIFYIVLISAAALTLLLVVEPNQLPSLPGSAEKRARKAIAAAADACSTGDRHELSRRVVDAQAAIRDAGYEHSDLEAALSNELILRGCRL